MPLPLALLALPGIASGLGSILGRSGQGAAQERAAQNASASNAYQTKQQAALQALLAQGRDKMNAYDTRQGATTSAMGGLQSATSGALANQSAEGLSRARLGLEAPTMRARQSVLGSLMKNLQPTSVAGPAGQRGHETKITGGLSASALDPMTREHGSALLKAALEAQLSGSDIPAATDFKGGIQDWKSSILDVPEATDYSKGVLAPPEYKEAGRGESWMSGLGGILSGIGAVGGAFNNAKANQPFNYDDQLYGYANTTRGRNG